ncbi:MAG: tripartite tricarboxylate transporter substrate binding protein [Bacteroidia bacterium]
MNTTTKIFVSACISMLAIFAFTGCKTGGNNPENYPSRPITLIVPWNPGGGTDLSSRAMASVLQEVLGQPVNVVNRTGGGGVVGHLAISQAKPDGYTLGAVTMEITMMHWQGLTDLTYQNFTPLALIMNNAASVTVRKDAPWNTLEELLSDIRANPGKFRASGTSKGGIWDLARIGFLKAAGLPESALPWVPSQGAAPALQELIAGGVDVVTAAVAEVDALRRAGEVKVLAAMAPERLADFPEIPTLREQGVDWTLGGWISIGAPAGLPAEIVVKLDSALNLAAQQPAYLDAMHKAGFNLAPMQAAAFSAFIQEQDRINGELIQAAGLAKE